MREKIFAKRVILTITVILVATLFIKAYSVFTFPHIMDWNWKALQKIDSGQDDFSFIVLGDNKNSITTFNRIIERINNEDVLFVIDDGDLVFDGEREKFRFFIHQIKRVKKPFLTVIGNHETREKGRANYYDLFGPFYYSFSVRDSYFIVLDDANEKDLDPWQMRWLQKQLETGKTYDHLFVFMHVPLFDPRKGDRKKGHSLQDVKFAYKLNNLLDKYPITMLFASHIHGYFRGIWGKTPYIITGGAGAELFGTDPTHYFYHYIRVNIKGKRVTYDIVKFKSPKFKIINRLSYMAWIYIYAFFSIHFLDIIIVVAFLYLGWYVILIKKRWVIFNIRNKR